jgi:hypothetical protein
MLVTGQPLVVSGIVISPSDPVYPVMVIAPLLVVKVNWACTTAGVASKIPPSSQTTRKACEAFIFRDLSAKSNFNASKFNG